jgi:hypothetical protein
LEFEEAANTQKVLSVLHIPNIHPNDKVFISDGIRIFVATLNAMRLLQPMEHSDLQRLSTELLQLLLESKYKLRQHWSLEEN